MLLNNGSEVRYVSNKIGPELVIVQVEVGHVRFHYTLLSASVYAGNVLSLTSASNSCPLLSPPVLSGQAPHTLRLSDSEMGKGGRHRAKGAQNRFPGAPAM